MIINIYTLIQINKTVTFNSKHAWSTPWSPSRASINVMNPPHTHTNQCFVFFCLFHFKLRLRNITKLPSSPCLPSSSSSSLTPTLSSSPSWEAASRSYVLHKSPAAAHLSHINPLNSPRVWYSLRLSHMTNSARLWSAQSITQHIPWAHLTAWEWERVGERLWSILFGSDTLEFLFFFFGSESCVNVWACDSRVQLEWNVFFFVLFPTKAHHYDFFNRKTFYSCCCFDASSWQTSDWCYFSWMFSEDGGVLGVVMLGQKKIPTKSAPL